MYPLKISEVRRAHYYLHVSIEMIDCHLTELGALVRIQNKDLRNSVRGALTDIRRAVGRAVTDRQLCPPTNIRKVLPFIPMARSSSTGYMGIGLVLYICAKLSCGVS